MSANINIHVCQKYLSFVEIALPEVKCSNVVVDFWRNFDADVVLQY